MKNLSQTKLMKKTLILSFILGAMASTAFAVPTPIPSASELPEFDQFDTPLVVPSYESRVIYRFNPPGNGVMTVYEKANDAYLFVGRFYNQHEYSVLGGWYGTGPVETLPEGYDYGFAYPMESDQQYYISIPLESYNQTSEVLFTWEQEEEQEMAITTIIPEPSLDEPFDTSYFHDILVFANASVTSFSSVTLCYGDKEIELPKGEYCGINGSSSSQFLQIIIAGDNMKNYIERAINAGATQVCIIVKGLCAKGIPVTGNFTDNDCVEVEDGVVSFKYAVVPEGGTSSISLQPVGIEEEPAVYNLNGVKVDPRNLGKGIYVVNGKKVVK